MLQTRSARFPVTVAALVGAAIGAASIVPCAALARDVTLVPLLLLHPPAVLVLLALHSSSGAVSAFFGAVTFAAYGAVLFSQTTGWRRAGAGFALAVFHIACLLIVNFCAPIFGL